MSQQIQQNEQPQPKRRRKKTPNDSVSKLEKIVNIFTSKRGLIFLSILILFSILEIIFKVESTFLQIIKTIIQFLFLID